MNIRTQLFTQSRKGILSISRGLPILIHMKHLFQVSSMEILTPDQRQETCLTQYIVLKPENYSKTQWMQVLKIFVLRLVFGWQQQIGKIWKASIQDQGKTEYWTKTNISPILRWSFAGGANWDLKIRSRVVGWRQKFAWRQFARGAWRNFFSQGHTSKPKIWQIGKGKKGNIYILYLYRGESNWLN